MKTILFILLLFNVFIITGCGKDDTDIVSNNISVVHTNTAYIDNSYNTDYNQLKAELNDIKKSIDIHNNNIQKKIQSLDLQHKTTIPATQIGYINIDTLLSNSVEFQKSQKAIAAEFRRKDERLTVQAGAIEKLLKDFQEKKEDLSTKEKEERIAKIRTLDKDLKQEVAKVKQQFELQNQEELQKIQDKINKTINEFAKKHKFSLILYKDIAYIDNKLDITNKISTILNK